MDPEEGNKKVSRDTLTFPEPGPTPDGPPDPGPPGPLPSPPGPDPPYVAGTSISAQTTVSKSGNISNEEIQPSSTRETAPSFEFCGT